MFHEIGPDEGDERLKIHSLPNDAGIWHERNPNDFHEAAGENESISDSFHIRSNMRKVNLTYLSIYGKDAEDQLLDSCIRYCDWNLIIRILENYNIETLPEDKIRLLAWSHWKLQQNSRVDHVLKSALLADPNRGGVLKDFEEYSDILANIPFLESDLSDGLLTLYPLSEHHMDEFRWQYADPNIAHLCNLPQFESDMQWLDWLHANLCNKNKGLFAVLHSEWGFIGSVSLEVHNGVGFFYYWLGKPFQGLGLGPGAVRILLNIGRKYFAMESCFAKCLDSNQRSIGGMKKLGFKRVPLIFLPPDDKELIFYFGQDKSTDQLREEFSCLLKTMDSDVQIERPLLLKP